MVDRLIKQGRAQGLTQGPAGTVVGGFSVEERARLLAGTSLFAGLPPEDLRPLAEAAEVVTFQPAERIVNQGDPGESLYLVVDGRVEVLARINEDGIMTETVVAWMTVGDALGELSLLDGQPRSASCVAVGPVTCLRLAREPFLKAIEENWSLSHALHVVMAQRLRMADKLLAEHSRDPLTGLNNRRALADLYEREAQRVARVARQHGSADLHPLALVFCDVNKFKVINDTYGHQMGDEVLRAIADVLTAASRATDLVARYGGDEFVMLLPDAGVHGAELVMSRIRERIAERPPGPVPFTISLGYAIVDPENPQTLDELLSKADVAMYKDKEAAHAREAQLQAEAAAAAAAAAARSFTGAIAHKAELQ